jgi:hypothetical protein
MKVAIDERCPHPEAYAIHAYHTVLSAGCENDAVIWWRRQSSASLSLWQRSQQQPILIPGEFARHLGQMLRAQATQVMLQLLPGFYKTPSVHHLVDGGLQSKA